MAENISDWKIGIIGRERLGCPIFDEEGHESFLTFESLQVGTKVVVPGLGGNYLSVVESINGTHAKIEGLLANVFFYKDRGWVNLGFGDFSKINEVTF